VRRVRALDVQTIAPQHGSMITGEEMVGRFLDWLASIDVGIDAYPDLFSAGTQTAAK